MAEVEGLGRRRFPRSRGRRHRQPDVGGGCDELSNDPDVTRLVESAEAITHFAQRLVTPRNALAREYTEADLSREFRANGTTEPTDPEYRRLAENGFADWCLGVAG